jgi:hypothetical protein
VRAQWVIGVGWGRSATLEELSGVGGVTRSRTTVPGGVTGGVAGLDGVTDRRDTGGLTTSRAVTAGGVTGSVEGLRKVAVRLDGVGVTGSCRAVVRGLEAGVRITGEVVISLRGVVVDVTVTDLDERGFEMSDAEGREVERLELDVTDASRNASRRRCADIIIS